jgi:hypothetical protein
MLAGCDQLLDAIKDGTDDGPDEFALLEDGIALDGEAGTITLKFNGEIEDLENFAPLDYIKIETAGSSSGEKVAVYSKGKTVEDDDADVRVYMELAPKGINEKGEYEYEIKLEAVVKMAPSGKVTFAVSPADKTEPQASMLSANTGTGPLATQFSELGTDTIELDAMIEVKDKETLALISADDEDFPLDEKYRQTADIYISGEWTPIGTEARPFTGVFEGGYYVDGNNEKQSYKIFPNITFTENFSIFGYADGATFENVHIGEGSMTTTGNTLGGIINVATNTTFKNCSNAATLEGKSVGGICYNSDSTFIGCWNTGNIAGISQAGGISAITTIGSSFQNCYNTGDITGERAGGICGQARGDIIACYNTGTITAVDTAAVHIGGIVGNFSGSYKNPVIKGYITACYNTGDVLSNVDRTAKGKVYIGGITGYNVDGVATLTACYSTGTVSLTGSNHAQSELYAGGISGYSGYNKSDEVPDPIVTACYWEAKEGDGTSVNGIGYRKSVTAASDEGTYKFASGVWPSTNGEGGDAEWGTGDGSGSGSGKYWKSLGGGSVYPKLWFEN